jgi:dienelactone hydrolase
MTGTRGVPGSIARLWIAGLSILFSLVAQKAVPESDVRNTQLVDYKSHVKMPEYASRKQWEARRSQLRQQILSAAGLLPMPVKSALRPKIIRRLEYEDYSIDVFLIETLPGYYLGGNLYRPVGKKLPAPAVLLPHGHWKRGRLEDQPSYSVPALGINLARQGYFAITYDMVGFNDTQQTPHSFGGWAEVLWSFSPMGLQLWNSIRVVDYLQSLPEVDGRRIAATGASGGGSQTFLLAAVDERIGYAAPVNMVSAYMQGGDPCEEAANLHLNTSNVEIAAMMAPRPMLLVSSTHDWTRHTPTEEFPAIRHIYELYGLPNNVQNAHIDAAHNYNRQSREAVYRFLANNMQPNHARTQVSDEEYSLPSDEELLAFPKPGPRGVEGYAYVFQTWKLEASLQIHENFDQGAQREALRYVMAADWPSQVDCAFDGNRIVLSRTGKGDRVNGYWMPGKGAPALVVHSGGASTALHIEPVAQLLRAGRPVLIVEPFNNNRTGIQRERSDNYFLSYNRGESADRVQDILTGLAFLKSRYGGRPELMGLGDAGIWCIFAAAIAPISVDVIADLNGFGGSDEDFRDRFFVPGIQRAGGLTTALKLLNRLRGVFPAQTSAQVPAASSEPVRK